MGEENAHVSPKDFVELITDDKVKEETRFKLDSLSDDTLKAIAKDVVQGTKFFTNRPEVAKTAFMCVLTFVEELPDNIGSFYADMKDAGGVCINGLPTFFSCGMLSLEDTKKVIEYIGKIREAMDSI